jgi:DNA-directed RNA polymerase subunit K
MQNIEHNRHEKARIIGARALQIAHGAPLLIETEHNQPILIAAEEYDLGVLPFEIKRKSSEIDEAPK